MSGGPGVVQRRLIAAFQVESHRRSTVEQLAEIAVPGEVIEREHKSVCRRWRAN